MLFFFPPKSYTLNKSIFKNQFCKSRQEGNLASRFSCLVLGLSICRKASLETHSYWCRIHLEFMAQIYTICLVQNTTSQKFKLLVFWGFCEKLTEIHFERPHFTPGLKNFPQIKSKKHEITIREITKQQWEYKAERWETENISTNSSDIG